MQPIKNIILLIFPVLLTMTLLLSSSIKKEEKIDLASVYKEYSVTGSFILHDQKNDKDYFYNKSDYSIATTPASTFKICNSLIGLETGVISDENVVIPWDSVERQMPEWNKDNDLKTAFKNSTVWYYQELARRIGEKRMKIWLDKCNYGNKDTSGGIDKFWLTGGLRISPRQQIDFLKRLYSENLPFSKRSMSIVKKMMVMTDSSAYTLCGKTGWGMDGNSDIGWFVGYVETNGNVYFFCNRVYSKDPSNNDFARSRTEITIKALQKLKILN